MNGSDMRVTNNGFILRGLAAACLLGVIVATSGVARAQPVTLRVGYGTAAEEPLWLLLAKPDLARNQGKAYALDGSRFTGSVTRVTHHQAERVGHREAHRLQYGGGFGLGHWGARAHVNRLALSCWK